MIRSVIMDGDSMNMGDDAFRPLQCHMCLSMIEEQSEADIGDRFFWKVGFGGSRCEIRNRSKPCAFVVEVSLELYLIKTRTGTSRKTLKS